MLEQIRDEINNHQTIFLSFEDLGNQHLCEYNAFHDYVCEKQNAEIILENIVGLELLRRGYKIYAGRVGEKDGDKLYIQLRYLLNEESTIRREFGSLLEIKDNYLNLYCTRKARSQGTMRAFTRLRLKTG